MYNSIVARHSQSDALQKTPVFSLTKIRDNTTKNLFHINS